MKLADGWWFPDGERHLLEWMTDPRNRMTLNGRAAYQGKKIKRAIELAHNRGLRPMRTAVDVGAHIGLWSYNLAHAFNQVVAFEPVEAHRACFQKNVFEADEVEITNVTLHPFALGDHEDMISIVTGPASSGDSRVAGKGTIPMKLLDSFALEDVDLIKIDCEGYEEFVLRGAIDTIIRCRPLIVVEQKRDHATRFNLKPRGAVEYLTKGVGYEQVDEIGGDYFMAWNGGGK